MQGIRCMSRSQSTYASVVRAAAAATASASRRAGLGEGSTISGRVVSLLATRGVIEQLATVPGVAGAHIMAPNNEAMIPGVITRARAVVKDRAKARPMFGKGRRSTA